MTDKHLTNQTFADLDLPDPLKRGIEELGFERCTPIQAEALPVVLSGKDVAGQAQTGTGKTATFLLALFKRLMTDPGEHAKRPRALVLAPTRELAIQIHRDAQGIGRHTGLTLGLAYGGTGYHTQREELAAGVDVLIGTPGRLIDYYKQGVYPLDGIEVMVLDEADRMFDLGFIKDIRYLLRRMPEPAGRLNMLFSATLSHRVLELAYEHMNDAQLIKIQADKITVDEVTESIYYPASEEKISLLVGLLKKLEPERALVFTNTKIETEKLARWLGANDYDAAALSGDVPQKKRERLLQRFKDGELRILIATDVAARGLHIPDVTHVFNYDLPQDAEDYVHRVGRTARAGATGHAISFACERFAYSLVAIEQYLGHAIPPADIEQGLLVEPRRPRSGAARGRQDVPRSRGASGGADDRRRGRRGRLTDGDRQRATTARPAAKREEDDGAVEAGPPPARTEAPAALARAEASPSAAATVSELAPAATAPVEPVERAGETASPRPRAAAPRISSTNGEPGPRSRGRSSEAATTLPSAAPEQISSRRPELLRARRREVPAVG